ncbi:MAG TPA: hypothetical protein VN788_00045 [Verrucomicrobiae bacterium]|nr:hypothetical protein [Verrucomicrobiae bacterium]
MDERDEQQLQEARDKAKGEDAFFLGEIVLQVARMNQHLAELNGHIEVFLHKIDRVSTIFGK